MAGWTDEQYDVIFRAHPPTGPAAPSMLECEVLGRELDRSAAAVRSQWNDGRSIVLGHKNDASSALRDYLSRRGWI